MRHKRHMSQKVYSLRRGVFMVIKVVFTRYHHERISPTIAKKHHFSAILWDSRTFSPCPSRTPPYISTPQNCRVSSGDRGVTFVIWSTKAIISLAHNAHAEPLTTTENHSLLRLWLCDILWHVSLLRYDIIKKSFDRWFLHSLFPPWEPFLYPQMG